MLSFIIIGKNEGWKLTNCLESVFNTITINKLHLCEVIYIDSNSNDDSIQRAKKYKNIKILQITKESNNCNAAIARNIGADISKGKILFFIDADMEIEPSFLPLVYSEEKGLTYPFVSGQFINVYYKNKKIIKKENYHNYKNKIEKQYTTGGLFLIEKKIWLSIGGMKNHFRICEDIDLGLRLAKKGYFLCRYSDLLAIHHTVEYTNIKRVYNDYIKGNNLYRSILFRENIFNIYLWKLMLRQNYTSLYLFPAVIIMILTSKPFFLILYLCLIFLRVILKKKTSDIKYYLFPYFILRDISFWIAIVCFWKTKNIYISLYKP